MQLILAVTDKFEFIYIFLIVITIVKWSILSFIYPLLKINTFVFVY